MLPITVNIRATAQPLLLSHSTHHLWHATPLWLLSTKDPLHTTSVLLEATKDPWETTNDPWETTNDPWEQRMIRGRQRGIRGRQRGIRWGQRVICEQQRATNVTQTRQHYALFIPNDAQAGLPSPPVSISKDQAARSYPLLHPARPTWQVGCSFYWHLLFYYVVVAFFGKVHGTARQRCTGNN